MTIEEAINELQLKLNLENELADMDMDLAQVITIEAEKERILSRIKMWQENAEVFRMAIKALEKQIPKEAVLEMPPFNPDYWKCPKCEQLFALSGDTECQIDYCPFCGQHISCKHISRKGGVK